jgi:predicted nucleic acid-binding protein
MRLVVDTNVFVSAALKQGSAPGATIRWLEFHGGLLKTVVTGQELMAVLQRPRGVDLHRPAGPRGSA